MERASSPAHSISLVLKAGSYGSAALMLAGVVLALLRPARPVHYALRDLAGGLAALEPTAIMQAGIALLLITPVIRIVVAIASFAAEGDRKYAWISLGVLAIVLSSIVLKVVH